MVDQELIRVVRAKFELDWRGLHGISHWRRVRENGLRLAASTGARTGVIDLFAFLHDSCRVNNGFDMEHGTRAARFVETLRGSLIDVGDCDFYLLVEACEGHSMGGLVADVTVQTCWDADRLDLGRIGIRPRPDRLCTEAAKAPEMIEWAYERSLRWLDDQEG